MQASTVRGKAVNDPVSVSQFNTIAKGLLTGCDQLRDVWVRGEISNLKPSAAGHYYFTIKDAGSELACTLFRSAASRLRTPPVDKQEVLVKGSADLYLQRGSYQFNVTDLRPVGIGDLHARFEELKRRLESEGLFDPARKRPLPSYPDRIGVVTSPTGSVIRDIITVASRRYPCEIIVAPAQVQGEGAADSVIRGMGLLVRLGVDLIIIARGGGSLEDLWAFNEESLARAVRSCSVPVISAVGHETDFSISDFVADRRAPTPSAAAEIALKDLESETRTLIVIAARSDRALGRMLQSHHSAFNSLDRLLAPRRAQERVEASMQRVDDLDARMNRSMAARWERCRAGIDRWSYRLDPVHALNSIKDAHRAADDMLSGLRERAAARVVNADRRLTELSAGLDALDPHRVLDRGYAMVVDRHGRPVVSAFGAEIGDTVNIRLQDGSLGAEIKGRETT